MNSTATLEFNNGKGLTDLACYHLGWIDAANKAIQEVLGLSDNPKWVDEEMIKTEMLTRTIVNDLSEVHNYFSRRLSEWTSSMQYHSS
jgi:hypothetical protein